MKVWKYCLDNKKIESELKGRIMGVKVQMQSFHLYFDLNLATHLYSHTDNLAKPVQSTKMSAASSKRLNLKLKADLAMQVLESLNL